MKITNKHGLRSPFISYVLFFVALWVIDVSFRAMYGFAGATDAFDFGAVPVIFTLGWTMMLTAFAAFLPRPAARVYIILTTVICGVLAITNAVMYKNFGSFLSFSDIQFAGDGAKFISLSYLKVRKLLITLTIAAVLMAVASAVILPKTKFSQRRMLSFALLFSVGIGVVLWQDKALITDTTPVSSDIMTWNLVLKEDTAPAEEDTVPVITMESEYSEFSNSNVCLPMTGLYQYTVRNICVTYENMYHDNYSEAIEAIDEFAENKVLSDENSMTGAFSGKNVIMIMAESLDTWMINEEYTPNIYKLQQDSINFVNNYTPLYLTGGTFGTEFISMTGIIPPLTGISNDSYVENSFPYSLPRLFAAKGYAPNSFHSQPGIVYNRFKIHDNLGFIAYYTNFDMGMENDALDSQLINGFESMAPSDKPFFSFVITYSGHGPYDIAMDNIAKEHLAEARKKVAAAGITDSDSNVEEYTRAIAQIMQTDDFIGDLVASLKNSGQLDNTVIILYGDHYCKYLTDNDFIMKLKGVDDRNLLCNTPLMIYSSDHAPETVDKYVSSVDIFPTVCNLFDLDVDLSNFVGDDAFGTGGGYVYWRDYSWYDGTTYYNYGVTNDLTFNHKQRCREVRQKLSISWDMMKYDYFAQK